MVWLEQFKLVILNERFDEFGKFISTMPVFENVTQMREALALTSEAISLLDRQKADLSKKMELIKKNKIFIQQKDKNPSFKKSF